MATKAETVANIAAALEITKVYAEQIVEAVHGEISRQLISEGEAKVLGVGTLKVKELAAREFRSPGSDQKIVKPARKTVKLAATAGIKAAVNA